VYCYREGVVFRLRLFVYFYRNKIVFGLKNYVVGRMNMLFLYLILSLEEMCCFRAFSYDFIITGEALFSDLKSYVCVTSGKTLS
jgi:hypothetical protein